jgi:acylphosphatase
MEHEARGHADPHPMKPQPAMEAPAAPLSKGDEGDEVDKLYHYLRRYGYFPNADLDQEYKTWRAAVPFDPDDTSKFDDTMERAVRQFQRTHGLDETGELDEATRDLMQKPRCGVPDHAFGAVEYRAFGTRWSQSVINYHFMNFTPDVSQAEARAAVRGAFDRWQAVIPRSFAESASSGQIEIGWFTGSHGGLLDTSGFDGPGGTLAHAFYPPGLVDVTFGLSGDVHFDEAERWSVNLPATGTDLPTVALHEIGHALGLDHSSVSSAVMYAFYGGPRRELVGDDVAGIQSIYGAKFRWASLGGIVFEPTVANNADGRLEVFVRGSDNALHHKWQVARNNGWSGWSSLGGVIQGAPAVGRNKDGRLEVFVRGSDGALYHKWQVAPNSTWSGWSSLGGWVVNPVVASNADGRLEVFVQGGDGALYHKWQTAPNNGWSGWASRGGVMGSRVAVANNADGRLEVFVRGTDGALYHQWQTAPNNGWSGWSSLGGVIQGAPAVGRNKDGRLEVFARGTDGALYQKWQVAPNNGWSGWARMGGVISDPYVISNADGRLEVFVRGSDTALWHIWQTAPNNGWSGWATLSGQIIGAPVVGRNADGRLEAFVKGTDSALWHTWQNAPNNGWV